MNPEQAKKFIEKYPGATSFVKPSHLEELSPLLEVHIEAIVVKKSEFHEMDGGKAYMPRKETLDKFAAAAGVSYVALDGATRKESETCYVGRSQAMVMGPDGKWIIGDVCEYEFDAADRLEELRLSGKKNWEGVPDGGRPNIVEYTEKELAKERIKFKEVGRQRANTGARNRATVSILGMPTGIKGLYQKRDREDTERTFLFSRIIINAKNELVMNKMLDNLGANAAAIAGPAMPSASLPPPAAREQEPRRVGPGFDDRPGAQDGATERDPFGDTVAPSTAAPPNPRVTEIITALAEWSTQDGAFASRAQAIIDRGEDDVRILEASLLLIKYVASGKLRENGIKACLEALDKTGKDPIVLEATVVQAKAAHDARSGVGAGAVP